MLHCPRCNTQLRCLPNPLKFVALLMAVLAIVAHFILHGMGLEDGEQFCDLIVLASLLTASVAVVYFPRFCRHDPDERNSNSVGPLTAG